MRFNGKTAFVTGGSTGIGRAAAEQLAREGANVAILARDRNQLAEVCEAIQRETGSDVLPIEADVSSEQDMVRVVDEIRERYGRLDVVVANAGINGVWAPLEKLDRDEWQHTIDVNLTGTFLTLKFAVPLMKEDGGGSIVIVSSINGTRTFSNSGATAYSAAKAGQVAMAEMLALELAPAGIRVNAICPGMIDTDIPTRTQDEGTDEVRYPVEYPAGSLPLTGGKPGRPEQVASLIAFLCSDDADLVTGSPVWIDGAQSLL